MTKRAVIAGHKLSHCTGAFLDIVASAIGGVQPNSIASVVVGILVEILVCIVGPNKLGSEQIILNLHRTGNVDTDW